MSKKIIDKDNNKESEYGPIHSNRFNVNPNADKTFMPTSILLIGTRIKHVTVSVMDGDLSSWTGNSD